jgi:hypothetical protein
VSCWTMNMTRTVLALALAMVVTAGCAKPPQQELGATEAALAQAEELEAATYAETELTAAREALAAARAEIDTQNAKFALFRSYKKGGELLTEAQTKAVAAKDAAVEGKEAARVAAQEALTTAETSVGDVRTLLEELAACKRRPKDLAADLEALRGVVDGLATAMAEATAAMDREDLLTATSGAEAVDSRAMEVANDIRAAKTKLNC